MVSRRWFSSLALLAAVCVCALSAFAQISAPHGLTVFSDGANTQLRWDVVPGASTYNIYKDSNPNVDMSFPYDVANTNSYTDVAAIGNKFFYVVTANVPAGCITGTITDTSGVVAPDVWISGKLQSDTTIEFNAKTLANGTFSACDLHVGTYNVWVYLEYRPVLSYEVTILDGQSVTLNAQWQPFDHTHIAGGTHLTGDVYWTNDQIYQLMGYCWVDSGARLFVEKGTTIIGTDNPNPQTNSFGTMMVRPGGQIFCYGDRYLPICMTSAKRPGLRHSGDWGGITLMGHAQENRHNNQGDGVVVGAFPVVNPVEGIPAGDVTDGRAGNPDTLSNNESSGVLRYLRVEYGGFRFNDSNELNGIAMYGVGRGTQVDYVCCSCNKDDQFEMFGGCCNIRHIIIHNSGDDGLDWTDGWNGLAQWVLVHLRGQESESTIEADNYEGNWDAWPRSEPKLANFTLVGAKGAPSIAAASQEGMMIRRGTLVNMHNSIHILGNWSGIDIDDSSTAWQASRWASDDDSINNRYWLRVPNGKIKFDNMIWWNNGLPISESIDPTTPAGIGDGHFWVETGLSGGGLNHANAYRAEWDSVNCRPTQFMPINTITLCAPLGWTQEVAPNYHGCGYVGQNATSHVVDPMLINPTPVYGPTLDCRPSADSPIVMHPEWAAQASELPAGIVPTNYIGAFSGPTDDWANGPWVAYNKFYEDQ